MKTMLRTRNTYTVFCMCNNCRIERNALEKKEKKSTEPDSNQRPTDIYTSTVRRSSQLSYRWIAERRGLRSELYNSHIRVRRCTDLLFPNKETVVPPTGSAFPGPKIS